MTDFNKQQDQRKTYQQVIRRGQSDRITELEAENARLMVRVKELEAIKECILTPYEAKDYIIIWQQREAIELSTDWTNELVADRDENIASMQQHILATDKLIKAKDEEIARLRGVLETVLIEASLVDHFTDIMYVGLPIKVYEAVAKTLEGEVK